MTILDLKNVKTKVDKRKSQWDELKSDLEARREIWNKLDWDKQLKWLEKDPTLKEAKDLYLYLLKYFRKGNFSDNI